MAEKTHDRSKDIVRQIAEKIKSAENVLITVNSDPTVDELVTALALTLAIDSMDKHATALASGKIPDALEFLNPEKTFENSVDSLQDFIISLNKDKADHLRYKIEGDFVKVFITPYRTTISESDLEFSRGDYNVELVIALNVKTNDTLDEALRAHGKILHDATVVSITTSDYQGIGDLYWNDTSGSSLAEMAESLLADLSSSDGKPVVNKAVATALLTGIVASTDRFSNERTSSKTMEAAAKLMKSGADQQLVVSNLDQFHKIAAKTTEPPAAPKSAGVDSKPKDPTKFVIDRGEPEIAESAPDEPEENDEPVTAQTVQSKIDLQAEKIEEAKKIAQQRLADQIAATNAANQSAVEDLKNETEKMMGAQPEVEMESTEEPLAPAEPTPEVQTGDSGVTGPVQEPAEALPGEAPLPVEPVGNIDQTTAGTSELKGAVSDWQRHILPLKPIAERAVEPTEQPPAVNPLDLHDQFHKTEPAPVQRPDASIFGSALTPATPEQGIVGSAPAPEPIPAPEPVPEPVVSTPEPVTPAPEPAYTPEPIPTPAPAAPVAPIEPMPAPAAPAEIGPMPDLTPVAQAAPSAAPVSPFVPPLPPMPPAPGPIVADAGLPLPPAELPTYEMAMPAVAPQPMVVPEAPAANIFENNTPVMTDQIYPQPVQSASDVGSFRIPGM